MAVDPEDRDAYERGQQEADNQSNPLYYLFAPSQRNDDDTESETAAFDKGLNGEQLDGDKD